MFNTYRFGEDSSESESEDQATIIRSQTHPAPTANATTSTSTTPVVPPTNTSTNRVLLVGNASLSTKNQNRVESATAQQPPIQDTVTQQQSGNKSDKSTHSTTKSSSEVDVTKDMSARDFHFPYEAPYGIQVDFMKALYRTIDRKKIGIFESPTGTGKSLSIICGSFTWLLDQYVNSVDNASSSREMTCNNGISNNTANNRHSGVNRRKKRQVVDSSDDDDNDNDNGNNNGNVTDEPAWIREQQKQIVSQNAQDKLLMEREKQEKRKDRVDLYQRKMAKFLMGALETVKKQEKSKQSSGKDQRQQQQAPQDDSDLLLVDFDEDRDSGTNSRFSVLNKLNIGVKGSLLEDLFSSDEEEEMNAAMKKKRRAPNSIFAEEDNDEDENPDMYHTPKIIYCSRTHTQLNQFVHEVQKTDFREKVRLVSLASRKQMCSHPVISKIQSQNRINELCLDMKRKSDKRHKCPYDDSSGFKLFKDHVLIKMRDIEDLVSLGKRLETCSYYGSRKAVPQAQVITIPYNSLIHQQTRESLGIKLEECVVIIDEAHNLVDSVVHTHSFQVTQAQVQQCHMQLTAYFERYKSRLKAANQTNVTQLLQIMTNLLTFLKSGITGQVETGDDRNSEQTITEVLNLNDFSYRTQINNINMFHVCEFITRSELTKKLNGFVERRSSAQVSIHRNNKNADAGTTHTDGIESAIHIFTSFLLALTNISKDGKILVQMNKTDPSNSLIKFVLLNPSVYFKEIVEQARSVILAGGTMEPISSVIQQLFPEHNETEHIVRFQCGHVIPDENILPICLSTAPSSNPFDFTFKSRNSATTMNDLGTLVCNMCNVVPDGVVLFFPSYSYESAIYDYWFKSGIIRKIEMKKKYFREPKSSTEVDRVLSDYKQTIDRAQLTRDKQYSFQGAVLSCVVGGKMSEGINFSDGYGRLVVVIGLPYPNPNDLELKEKMNYLNARQKGSGTDYYDDLCMKAVNQSIGRSIRHANDYASILLLDQRYSRPNIQAKLPSWIRSRLVACDSFGPAFAQVAKFFKAKQASS